MDVAGALIALPIAAPVIATLAVAVRLAMGRPIFFVQQRAGRDGRPFALRKFRSMTADVDAMGMPLPDAERTPRMGRLLRRSRLDELPELWEILKGDMSFIGPRPLLPPTIAAMGEKGVQRGAVRPGLTGWAQISGNSSLDNDDKLALDLWYIRHRSIPLDLFILAKTVGLMLFGEKVCESRLRQAKALESEVETGFSPGATR